MSIRNILKKVFNTGSDTLSTVENQHRENYLGTPKEGETISEQVQSSPLFIRGNDENGYFIILGNYKVTQKMESMEIARTIAEQTDWVTIMNVVAVMIETAFKLEKQIDLDMATLQNKKESEVVVDKEPFVGTFGGVRAPTERTD